MGTLFHKLFNLYPGEWKQASVFIILGLFWSIGGYGTFALSEGLFLENVGPEYLPMAYVAIATSMCLLSLVLIFSLHRLSIRYILLFLLGFWITTNIAFSCILPSQNIFFLFLFKIAGWMMPLSTYIVYWAFIDLYFDLQDGKRLFCLFNSITFLGDSLGGAVITFLLKALGCKAIIYIFTAFMVISLPFIFLITRFHSQLQEGTSNSFNPTARPTIKSILSTIVKSKFTLCLLGFYILMQLLSVVTEFNYMTTFKHEFSKTNEYDLTKFIGECGMWISLGTMLFGMFIYSRLVKKIGVNNIVIITPVFFFIVFMAWNIKEAMSVAIFAIVAKEGLLCALDDNNLNLLISGVPVKIKNQVRVSVESFCEPLGMFGSALLLLIFHNKAYILGIILSVVSLGVMFFLRKNYSNAIFKNLVANSIRFEKKAIDWIFQKSNKERKQAIFLLLYKLKNNNETEQLLAYEYLIKIQDPKTLPHLLNNLGKLSIPGKLKAISLFKESKWATEAIVLERLERLRGFLPHPSIKSAIHFYFAYHGLMKPERVIKDLQSTHLGVRSAAILTFKKNPNASQFPSCCSLASEKLNSLLKSKMTQEICVGLEILGLDDNPKNVDLLLSYISNKDLQICQVAALALSKLASPNYKEFATKIIDQLPYINDANTRLACLHALEKLRDVNSIHKLILASQNFRHSESKAVEKFVSSFGHEITDHLLELTCNISHPHKCRLLAGKILGKIDRKLLQKHVYPLIQTEVKKAYFYFYHSQEIQKQVPEQDLSILENSLYTTYLSVIDFIVQILGVVGSIEESEILSHTIHSHHKKIRAQAVESIEKNCDPQIFSMIEPLIDERLKENKIAHYLKNGGVPYNLTQLLDTIQHSSSVTNQIVSIILKAQLKMPGWKNAVKTKLESGDKIFKRFAYELLEKST